MQLDAILKLLKEDGLLYINKDFFLATLSVCSVRFCGKHEKGGKHLFYRLTWVGYFLLFQSLSFLVSEEDHLSAWR